MKQATEEKVYGQDLMLPPSTGDEQGAQCRRCAGGVAMGRDGGKPTLNLEGLHGDFPFGITIALGSWNV